MGTVKPEVGQVLEGRGAAPSSCRRAGEPGHPDTGTLQELSERKGNGLPEASSF